MFPQAKFARSLARAQSGMTLLELVIACGILLILASAAMPVARYAIRRQQESELRIVLREMRNAIDRYKDTADRNLIQVELGTEGYPPDLDTLVRGVELAGAPGRRVRFLRRIPVDPLTGRVEWGLRCIQDEPKSRSWCGSNVFDVYSLSLGTGLDGRPYAEW
jgi:general secretion pathway protein G